MRSQLESIRPTIKGLLIKKEISTMEYFQNNTLRPILKFQNSLLLSIFNYHLKKSKIILDQLTDIKKEECIEKIIQKDQKIRHVLLGVIIGHFTETEYLAYIKHEKELNRRITNILIQRLQNQL